MYFNPVTPTPYEPKLVDPRKCVNLGLLNPKYIFFLKLEASANEKIFENWILNLYFFFIQIPYKRDQSLKP